MWRSYYISFENPISFMPYDICRQKLKRPVRFANNIWLIAYLTISIVVWTRSCIKIFWCICFAYACSKWVKAQLFFSFLCSVNCFLRPSSSPSLQSCGANESVVNVTTFNPTEEIEGKKKPNNYRANRDGIVFLIQINLACILEYLFSWSTISFQWFALLFIFYVCFFCIKKRRSIFLSLSISISFSFKLLARVFNNFFKWTQVFLVWLFRRLQPLKCMDAIRNSTTTSVRCFILSSLSIEEKSRLIGK